MDHGTPSTAHEDMRIVRAAIHPSIGIARVGNSEREYYIGPEVPAPLPAPPGFYRDATGALKREAAQFRIYGYNAAGQVVAELTSHNADITWTVTLANEKAAWYEFQLALDIPEAAAAPPSNLRNASIKERASLIIAPGSRTIRGKDTRGAGYVFDSGSFMGTLVYLGELRTDVHGRLLVLGGHGVAQSHDGKPATTFANNDGWHDDVSDGPVTATVSVDGRTLPVDPAWVIVAPPNYAPARRSVRTMYDLMFDLFVQSGSLPVPARPSFSQDILPIFERLAGLQWVNAGFAAQYGWQGPSHFIDPAWLARLASPAPAQAELRQQLANQFRNPERDGWSPVPWPWLYGDAMDVPPAPTERQNASLTATQLRFLQQWAAGDFDADYESHRPPRDLQEVPLAEQPATLDKAALSFCLADAFHPGCEMTWPVRHATMYMAPFRIRHRRAGWQTPSYGSQLTPQVALSVDGPLYAQAPGGLTRWMAVPWQTDTASCRSGYYAGYGVKYDPYLPTFWPARVPNQVLTEADYRIAVDPSRSRSERLAAFARRASWFRRLGPGGYEAQINKMAQDISVVGVVETRAGVEHDPDLPPVMEVEQLSGPELGGSHRIGTMVLAVAPEADIDAAVAQASAETGVPLEEVTAGIIEKVHRFPHGLDRR
jgi:hypothetical protein